MSNPPRSDSTVVVATAYPLPSSVRSRAAPSPLAQRRSKLAQQQAQAGPSNRLNDRGVPSAHSLNAESLANASQLGSAPGSRVSSRTNFLASRSSVGLGGGSLSAPNPAIGNTSANSTTSFASTSTLAAPLLAPTGGQAGRLIESAGPDIVERPRDRTRNHEVAASSLAFLYSEMVQYVQGRVSGIAELEKRLSLMGYTMGQKLLAMTSHRLEMSTNGKNPKREVRLLPVLLWVHTHLWKQAFGKSADSLERSTERNDEYMISTNVPFFSKSISIPKDMSQLSVEAITAGIVEAALDGLGFPARVTAHSVPTPEYPFRTTILIKLDPAVMKREEALGS